MATTRTHTSRLRPLAFLRRHWRSILGGIVKWSVLLLVGFETIYGLLGNSEHPVAHINGLFVVALFCTSLAYLFFVSTRVHLRMPGVDESVEELEGASTLGKADAIGRFLGGRFGKRAKGTAQQDVTTIQVRRLGSSSARVSIVNDAPLPVLRAQTSLVIARESEDDTHVAQDARRTNGTYLSLRAHSARPASLFSGFNHVGIFRLQSAGIRVYDLLGLFSRVQGSGGQWRVRVVPNIYRLPYGIPWERKVAQTSLGIPDAPADALDYDRVRDYRPGDPLKTIHWKLVAHCAGELYTKLFETPTVTNVTLLLDPHDPNAGSGASETAYHRFDTMLEGGLSLLEFARENEIDTYLRYTTRAGVPVEVGWTGLSARGWLVETARRPSSAQDARVRSITSIRSLQNAQQGYVIFATSGLSDASVAELISCHNVGIPLLVVHALPDPSHSEGARQRSYDARLREASIAVVGLLDGPQIMQEVMAS